MRDRERHMSRAELGRSALVNLSMASTQLVVAQHELDALGIPSPALSELVGLVDDEAHRVADLLRSTIRRTKEEGSSCG